MNDASALKDQAQVRVERVLSATQEAVYAAWTDPSSMAGWMSPTGRAEVVAELRVGGRFRIVMLGDDTRIEHTGEYLVLEPPRQLSFTWHSPYTGDGSSVVTVTLAPEGDGTRLVLEHERLPREAVDPHAAGWTSILDNLAGVLAASGASVDKSRRRGTP